jgi:hypothetical protein
VSDPVFDVPRELEPAPPTPRAVDLLRRPDFRRVYLAVAASELGDSLPYLALMWFAFDIGGARRDRGAWQTASLRSSSGCTAASPPIGLAGSG